LKVKKNKKVPVGYVSLVHVVHCQQQLLHNASCCSFVESSQLTDSFVQLSALNQLGNDVVMLFVFQELENSHDIRMGLFTSIL